ncbi:MAG: DNA-binding response regulator [Proteobacteria bacterium]|nr:DNA-binding response regulator [Pseudomonadota bacterium]
MKNGVLIVEPDPGLRSVMVEYFTLRGMECDEAGSLDDLIGRVSSGSHHSLMILDPFLGPHTGFDLIGKIRSGNGAFASLQASRIILHTTVIDIPEEILNLIDEHILKPAALEFLLSRAVALSQHEA